MRSPENCIVRFIQLGVIAVGLLPLGRDVTQVSSRGDESDSKLGTIAYAADCGTDSKYDIYTIDLDDPNAKPELLVASPGDDRNPQFSPNGDRMVFYSDPEGSNKIYILNNTTGKLELFFDPGKSNQAYDPAFAPDGKSVVVKIDREKLVDGVMVRDPGDLIGVPSFPRSKRTSYTVLTAEDGVEEWKGVISDDDFFYTTMIHGDKNTNDIWRKNLETGEKEKLTGGKTTDNWFPELSPDGTKISFTADAVLNGPDQIANMDADGSNQELITDNPDDTDDAAFITNDVLAYIMWSNPLNKYRPYTMNIDGSNQQPIENIPDECAVLSPVSTHQS